MPQQFEQAGSQQEQTPEEQVDLGRTATAETDDDVLDSVLDDIESVLATNAEEYVSSFVQKGGE